MKSFDEGLRIPDEAELKQIAMDIADHKIYTDKHMTQPDLLPQVFLPIALGATDQMSKKAIEDIGMVYEYYGGRNQAPGAINGHPIFYSARFLSKSATKRVFEIHDEYVKLKAAFKNDKP